MSPLIDCVLQLLVFFMLSSSFAAPKIELRPPSAEGTPDGFTDQNALVVSASPDGRLFLDEQPIETTQLVDRLTERLAGRVERNVVFRGDRQISYEAFLVVLDAARQAGCDRFDLVHEKPREER